MLAYFVVVLFFFFKAEDGIRDYKVTGVQTCALPIKGGDDAHVGLQHPRPAEPLKLPLLEHPEELRLHGGTHLPDLIEKQRPARGLLEPSRPCRHGPGEGPFFVAEQLRLEQRFRERRAVQRDERPLRAPRPAVDQVRHDLLAGPRLPGEEHRRLHWGHFRGLTQHVAPGFRGADRRVTALGLDRKSTRLNSSHLVISYAVFCLKKKKKTTTT